MSFHVRQASLVAQTVKNLPAKQETRVPFLVREDLLENEMATHSSIPREFYGQRSLAAYSPRSLKELDTTEWLNTFTLSLSFPCQTIQNDKSIFNYVTFSMPIISNSAVPGRLFSTIDIGRSKKSGSGMWPYKTMQKKLKLVWGRQWSLTWLILTPSVTNSLTLECRIPAQQQWLWEVGGMTPIKYEALALTLCPWITCRSIS